jgi:hypothetical protein
VEQIKPGRLALWGVVGGLGPPLLFGVLGLLFGAPATVYLPLAGLGVVSAVMSGALLTTAVGAARRRALPPEHDAGKLGAN